MSKPNSLKDTRFKSGKSGKVKSHFGQAYASAKKRGQDTDGLREKAFKIRITVDDITDEEMLLI